MPSWARVHAETVARGLRGADAPARCRGACFQRSCRPQQQQRQARIAGGEMQLLAQFQIEPVDHPGDRSRRRRTQRFGERPQRVVAVRRLDQNQARRIEAEAVEAVSGKPAVLALPVSRHDQDDLFPRPFPFRGRRRNVSQNCHDEAEGGRQRAWRLGHDFVQGAASQAAVRQVGIERGEVERQGLAKTLPPRQQEPQFAHHGSAAWRLPKRAGKRAGRCAGRRTGKSSGIGHFPILLTVDKHVDVLCMF